MGAAASFSGIRKDWMDIFYAMKLKRGEVIKLFDLYNIVDIDHGGTIDVVELLTLLDIERTAFAERIFAAFDKDDTGKIDFYEFVISLWKFCTLGDGAINVFAFDLYDGDADGKLTIEEAQKLFREMFGPKVMENETVKAGLAELLRHALDKRIDIDLFRVYSKTHQALLYPVFAIQNKLKKATLGARTWESISQRHIQLHKGKTLPIRELMVLDKTLLRVSSMMRIVLDNTDRATHYKPVELPTPGAGNKRKYTVSPTSSAARRSSTSSHSSAGSQHQQQQQVQQEQEQQQQQQHGTTVSPSRASSPPPPAPYSSPAVAPKSLTNTFVGHARVAATAAVHGGQSIVAHHSSAPCPDPASPASPTSPTSPIGNPVPNNSCVSNHSPFSSSSPTGPSSHASNASSRGGGEGSSKPPVLLPQSDKFVAVQDLHISGPVHKVVRLSTKLRPRNSVDVR